jgi:hypothetical protein
VGEFQRVLSYGCGELGRGVEAGAGTDGGEVRGEVRGECFLLGSTEVVGRLTCVVKREFESIMVARQVVPKLNELESLIAEASNRRATATGPDPTPYIYLLSSPTIQHH